MKVSRRSFMKSAPSIPILVPVLAADLPAASPLPSLNAQGSRALSGFLAGSVPTQVPGVVVLVPSPDRVLYHEAFGKMNTAHGVDMRKDAIFRIASMTKALTSAATMMLLEEGRLALNHEVAKSPSVCKSPELIARLDLSKRK